MSGVHFLVDVEGGASVPLSPRDDNAVGMALDFDPLSFEFNEYTSNSTNTKVEYTRTVEVSQDVSSKLVDLDTFDPFVSASLEPDQFLAEEERRKDSENFCMHEKEVEYSYEDGLDFHQEFEVGFDSSIPPDSLEVSSCQELEDGQFQHLSAKKETIFYTEPDCPVVTMTTTSVVENVQQASFEKEQEEGLEFERETDDLLQAEPDHLGDHSDQDVEKRSVSSENSDQDVERHSVSLENSDQDVERRSVSSENSDQDVERRSVSSENSDQDVERRSVSLENSDQDVERRSVSLENSDQDVERRSVSLENSDQDAERRSVSSENNLEMGESNMEDQYRGDIMLDRGDAETARTEKLEEVDQEMLQQTTREEETLVSVSKLKTMDVASEEDDVQSETVVDLEGLKSTYIQQAQDDSVSPTRDLITTGISVKTLSTSFTSEQDDDTTRDLEVIDTGISVSQLKSSLTEQQEECVEKEPLEDVKPSIDRAKATLTFSQV
ncbi:uncharacterized protein LOC106475399 [Limulus polyphemus]|uniref:Uncharacterized protein LOC106475399 n=1 Tax=Limulus polyphemus TaxID=6850 RepID=A0ABM1BZD2_LIMPO|nr:uncharacterized protein LOC106475399 [Limulus polyphemus]